MKKLTITNEDNLKLNVDLVRYFKYKNDCFLIYTIGEFDEKNYQKLYLVKVMEELGIPVVQNIDDEIEWDGMQKIIKRVIKELKNHKSNDVKDLDYTIIEGIKIVNPRFFKLDSKLVDILASNYFNSDSKDIYNETEENSLEPVVPEVSIEPVPTVEPMASETSIEPVQTLESVTPENSVDSAQYNQSAELSKIENIPEEIDYKSLYFAMKRENESTTKLMDTVLTELVEYKQKYGELEK